MLSRNDTVGLTKRPAFYLFLDYSFGPRTTNLSFEKEKIMAKKLLTLLLTSVFVFPLHTGIRSGSCRTGRDCKADALGWRCDTGAVRTNLLTVRKRGGSAR